jgi:hypothetical protein
MRPFIGTMALIGVERCIRQAIAYIRLGRRDWANHNIKSAKFWVKAWMRAVV